MPVLAAMGDGKPPANSGYRVAPSSDVGDAPGADMLGVNFAGGNGATVPGSERFSFPATGQRDLAAYHHDARIPIMRVFGVHRARLKPAVEDLVALATQISLEFAWFMTCPPPIRVAVLPSHRLALVIVRRHGSVTLNINNIA